MAALRDAGTLGANPTWLGMTMRSSGIPKIHWIVLAATLAICTGRAASGEPSFVTIVDGTTNPQSIPLAEATFVFYEQVTSLEEQTAGLGISLLAKKLGWADVSAGGAYSRIRLAVAQARNHSDGLSAKLCEGRALIVEPKDLVAAYEELDAEMMAERQRILVDPAFALDASAKAEVKKFIVDEYRPQLRGRKVDYAKWLEVTKEAPEAVLDRRCPPAKQDSTSKSVVPPDQER